MNGFQRLNVKGIKLRCRVERLNRVLDSLTGNRAVFPILSIGP